MPTCHSDFELARPAPDGGKRYVSVSGLPVFDGAGRFIGLAGSDGTSPNEAGGGRLRERGAFSTVVHYSFGNWGDRHTASLHPPGVCSRAD
jgi:hypothetical protein